MPRFKHSPLISITRWTRSQNIEFRSENKSVKVFIKQTLRLVNKIESQKDRVSVLLKVYPSLVRLARFQGEAERSKHCLGLMILLKAGLVALNMAADWGSVGWSQGQIFCQIETVKD